METISKKRQKIVNKIELSSLWKREVGRDFLDSGRDKRFLIFSTSCSSRLEQWVLINFHE